MYMMCILCDFYWTIHNSDGAINVLHVSILSETICRPTNVAIKTIA